MVALPPLAAALLLLRAGATSGFATVPARVRPTRPAASPRLAASDRDAPLPDDPSARAPAADLRELRARMDRQRRQYDRLNAAQAAYAAGDRALPAAVHLVLFRRDTADQHVHTVQLGAPEQEVILAFESGDECAEFAGRLRELDFAGPSPAETAFAPFAQFCHAADTAMMLVPAGFGLTPPQANADDEDEEEDGEAAAARDGRDLEAWG